MNAIIPVLTIDGPSGVGKGTVSRHVAVRLGWHYLDSGALYRALAIAAEKEHISCSDTDALVRSALGMRVDFKQADASNSERVVLNNEDVTERLRQEAIGALASKIATIAPVRDALRARQQAFCKAPGLVADGRDMGTVIFPKAPYKVFLTASAKERAQRRHNQLMEKGCWINLETLLRDITQRDECDMQRSTAPLRPATDAHIIDTTDLHIEEVVSRVLSLVAC